MNATQGGYWTTDTSGTLTVCQSTDSWNVHYDANSNTLTLKDATIKSGGTNSHGIYAQSDNPNVSLTILLDGKNSVAGKKTGIYVEAWMATGPVKAVLTLKKAEGAAEGSLTASGEEESGAGIYVEALMSADSGGSGGSGDAQLIIEGVTVTAENQTGDGINLFANGENAARSLQVDGAQVTARGKYGINYSGAEVGTSALKLSGNALVDTRGSDSGILFTESRTVEPSGDEGGIVFDGGTGTVYGDATLRENLTIKSGQSLTVPDGASLSIPSDVTLTVNGGGTLTGSVTGNVIYKVTGVSLNQSEMTLIDGETGTLTAIFTPDNATNQAVTWESSDTSVATVNNGLVTAVGEGTATITVTTEDGGKTASCAVTVTSASEPDPDPTPEPEPEPEPEPTPEPEPEEPEEVYIPSAPIADGLHEYSMGTMLYVDGKRVKGLYEYEGALYYFDESGFMVTGWVELSDGWYYFGEDGKMVTGWLQIGNVWYYLEPKTGRMVDNGLHMVGRTTYYFYDWGGMASDWWYEDENGDWYFFGGSGAMKAAQWVEWKGAWYYLTETGKMAADTDIGGYYVNAEGVWVE